MLETGFRCNELESSVVCGCLPVGGGIVPPAASIALPLDDAPLTTCLLRAIIDVGEAFEEGFSF